MPSKANITAYACAGWILGISAGVYEISGAYVFWVAAGIALAALFIHLTYTQKAMVCVYAATAALVCGFVYMYAWNGSDKIHTWAYGQETDMEGVVRSYPKRTDYGFGFYVDGDEGRLQVYLPESIEIEYGDTLKMRGRVKPLDDRTEFLKRDRIEGIISEPQVLAIQEGSFSIKRFLYGIRNEVRDSLVRIFPYDEASLATGLLIGGNSISFSPSFKEHMQNSGTTHVVALSGYNISLLIVWAYILCGAVCSRRATFWAATICTGIFVVMTGAEASVVRAASMGMLVLLASHIGRVYSFRQAAVCVACCMLLIHPYAIRYDIGFLLSFLSLLGIVYISPLFSEICERVRVPRTKITKTFYETAGAQCAVLPLLLFEFGKMSWMSLLANIAILWVVPYAMLGSFFAAGVSVLSQHAAFFVGKIVYMPLAYMAHSIHALGSYEQVSASISWWMVIGCYACGAVVVYALSKRFHIGKNFLHER